MCIQNKIGFARVGGRFEWLKWRYSSLVTYFNSQAIVIAATTGSITYVSICVYVCAARCLLPSTSPLPTSDFRLPTSTFRIPTPAFSRLSSCIHGMRHAAYICITVTKYLLTDDPQEALAAGRSHLGSLARFARSLLPSTFCRLLAFPCLTGTFIPASSSPLPRDLGRRNQTQTGGHAPEEPRSSIGYLSLIIDQSSPPPGPRVGNFNLQLQVTSLATQHSEARTSWSDLCSWREGPNPSLHFTWHTSNTIQYTHTRIHA